MRIALSDVVGPAPDQGDWKCPVMRFAQPGSLSDVLKRQPGILRALLPDSRRAITQLNRALRRQRQIVPSDVTKRLRLHSTVAQAVDRGVLYLYGHDIGAQPKRYLADRSLSAPAERLREALEVYEPPRHGVLRHLDALAWFYVLGTLEPVMRGFRPLSDIPVADMPKHITVRSVTVWLERMLAPEISDEISNLLRSVRDSRVPGVFTPNPVFGGVGIVTGSDGDWISGNTLVEMKCAVSGVRTEHVAQLLIYYALDRLGSRDDTTSPRFDNLALCMPRQSATVVGRVDEWLRAFGGPNRERLPFAVVECFSPRSRRVPDSLRVGSELVQEGLATLSRN